MSEAIHEPWMDDAACRSHPDPDIWFPTGLTDHREAAAAMEAMEICAMCPVRRRCGEFADRLEAGRGASMCSGIFAGMFPEQRIAKRRSDARRVSRAVMAS